MKFMRLENSSVNKLAHPFCAKYITIERQQQPQEEVRRRRDSQNNLKQKEGAHIVNKNGEMEIHASKSLKLTAPRIDLN